MGNKHGKRKKLKNPSASDLEKSQIPTSGPQQLLPSDSIHDRGGVRNEQSTIASCQNTSDFPISLWFRHSGEEEIEGIPHSIAYDQYQTIHDESHLQHILGTNVITHVRGSGSLLKTLPVLAPNLTHLKVDGVADAPSFTSLSQLKQLKVLHLGGSDFSEGLPSAVGNLHSLTELRLADCSLKKLSDNLCQLKQLKILDLYHNQFAEGLPSIVGELCSLTELKLSRCYLRTLPDNFSKLDQLKVLDLSCNYFYEGLPSVVGELHSLTKLSLWRCPLKELPKNLSKLKQLKVLDLGYNKFSGGLPSVVGGLHSLAELMLSSCSLKTLPENLSQLKQLEVLDLDKNDFSEGLPNVVGELDSLTKLKLTFCRLKELPENLVNPQLKLLDLSQNLFSELPGSVLKFKGLERLVIKKCQKLKKIEEKILQLSNLHSLECEGCDSLESPPYAVCQQGISAIRTYFADLDFAEGVKAITVPVAVIGRKLSGKTSIIRSLQAGHREFTYRDETSPLDETTKVFKLEELLLNKYRVRIIDYGGQEVYHIAYQLALKKQCIPLIVVNLEEFSTNAVKCGYNEATRRVCFDCLSHFYLAIPSLGKPLLALTHLDKLTPAQIDESKIELLKNVELLRENWLEGERVFGEKSLNDFTSIAHLSDDSQPVFCQKHIFEFDDDKYRTSNIVDLKENIENYCQDFQSIIPQSWEKIGEFIDTFSVMPYIDFSDIEKEFPQSDCETILRFMHHEGKILWFEANNDLSTVIFHQLPAITDMIAHFFNHLAEKQHDASINTFSRFTHKDRKIGKERYKEMLREFHEDGILDEALLHILVSMGSQFEVAVAEKLLRSFNIVHGPFKLESTLSHRMVYTVPYFTKKPLDSTWKTAGPLQLRLEILFQGLSLPEYVFQLISVTVLNRAKLFEIVTAARDGAIVEHEESTTHLIHDISDRKVTIQISTTVKMLAMSWARLKETANEIFHQVSATWKACHMESKMFCTHCLHLNDPNPGVTVDPEWLQSDRQFDGLQMVACVKAKKRSVPKPLMFPCFNLSDAEVSDLENYLKKLHPSAGT